MNIKMRLPITVLLAALVCSVIPCKIPLYQDGPHVCTRSESSQIVVQEPVRESYTTDTQEGPCWLPFHWGCDKKIRTLYRSKYQPMMRTQYKTIRVCCDGYTYDHIDDTCNHEPASCGMTLKATKDSQSVTSPCFPNNYQNNAHCVITITSPPGTVIEMNFSTFDLKYSENCHKDFVEITDCDGKLLSPSCSSSFRWPEMSKKVISIRDSLTLTFKSDEYFTSSGFEAMYRSVSTESLVLFVAAGEDELVLFYRNNVRTRHIRVPDMKEPIAVDYDPVSQDIYYSDAGGKHIGKIPLSRPEEASIIISKNIEYPTGLCVDVRFRLIYWTDEKLGTLSVSDMDGKYMATLIYGLSKPGEIVVDSLTGTIFFTVSEDPPRIERADGDGSNRAVIVSKDITSPRSLALDTKECVLYWIDETSRILQSVSCDGGNQRTLFALSNHKNVFSLVLDSGAFIFTHTNTTKGSLSSIDRKLNAERQWSMPDGGLYNGLILRPYTQAGSSSSPCANTECNGLCLPRPAGMPNTCVQQAELTSCGMDLIASPSLQNFSSPKFPDNYPNNIDCVINITSPQGTVVEVDFSTFDLEDSDNCSKDYLEVVDRDGPLLFPSCGLSFIWPRYTSRLVSADNGLTLKFVSDGNATASGFEATYRSVSPNPDIFVAARKDDLLLFYRHNVRSRKIGFPALEEPIAVDYDPRLQNIYYSDGGAKHIGKISIFNLEEVEVIHSTNIEYPIGLRVDESSRLLYWTDADLGTVSVSDLDGNNRTTIIDDLDSPGEIVVATSLGYIYYADSGASPRIERAEGDGSNREIIVSKDIVTPQSLAFDQEESVLYWIDEALGTLQSINYDGTNLRTIFALSNHQGAFSLVLDSEAFIFTHANTTGGSISLVDRELIEEKQWPTPDGGLYKGLTLRPFLETVSSTNTTCPNIGCNGLCLPRPSGMHTCVEQEDGAGDHTLIIGITCIILGSIIIAAVMFLTFRYNSYSETKYSRIY